MWPQKSVKGQGILRKQFKSGNSLKVLNCRPNDLHSNSFSKSCETEKIGLERSAKSQRIL